MNANGHGTKSDIFPWDILKSDTIFHLSVRIKNTNIQLPLSFLFLKKARPKKKKKKTNINYVIINNSADKNEAFIFLVFSYNGLACKYGIIL